MKIIQITSSPIGTGYQLNALDEKGLVYRWGSETVKKGKKEEVVFGWVLMEDKLSKAR